VNPDAPAGQTVPDPHAVPVMLFLLQKKILLMKEFVFNRSPCVRNHDYMRLLLAISKAKHFRCIFKIKPISLDLHEQLADTKGVIRNRISMKKSRQHNGQEKKYKRTNKDLQNIHIKLKME
jgi:hypothetical protein